jgi:hypothetical protein
MRPSSLIAHQGLLYLRIRPPVADDKWSSRWASTATENQVHHHLLLVPICWHSTLSNSNPSCTCTTFFLPLTHPSILLFCTSYGFLGHHKNTSTTQLNQSFRSFYSVLQIFLLRENCYCEMDPAPPTNQLAQL